MSHLSPFRLSIPNLGNDLPGSGSNPKKRRKNVQSTLPTPPNVQDLLPPPLSGYGDTIVASNPFDDCPNSVSNMSSLRNAPPMGMSPNMGMGMHNMNMCRGMGGPQINMGASGMIPSPNSQLMNNPMMIGGPVVNGPMGPQMGPHMISNAATSPIHSMSMSGPTHSPMGPASMTGMGNGSPMNGPMGGPNPMGNGPMNGIQSQMMNGPMGVEIGVSTPNGIGSIMKNNMMINPMANFYSKPMPVTAGKVYPVDQPMVFNSQNPNAPPIYPCGVCHKEVHDNDQAIPCESGCNFWFHRGCTGLTEMAYQYLTTEVYAEWVCDKCLSSKNIPLVKYKP